MPLKVKRHKRKTPRYVNKKKLRRKMKKMPKIRNEIILQGWNDSRSIRKNFAEMGLSNNPNESVIAGCENKTITKRRHKPAKLQISEALERNAKAPRVKKFKLPTPQVKYLSYLIKKYRDNYKGMASDSQNVYQETWKQIRSKIQQFRKVKQYERVFKSLDNATEIM